MGGDFGPAEESEYALKPAVTMKGDRKMAVLDWSQCSAVESVPGRLGGAWVFRGTRLPVATVIENLEDLSIDEVMEQFDVLATRSRRCSISLLRA